MTVRLLTVDGRQFELPVTLRWRILRTGGVPCDEIEAVCLYDGKLGAILPLCHRFAAYEGAEAVLRGVVDEYAAEVTEEGVLLRLSGRGMAALLIDNEAEAESYQQATLSEILRRHAGPYVPYEKRQELTGSGVYRVNSGSSQWRAVSGFTELAGGFAPYMTALGVLRASPLKGSGRRLLVEEASVAGCTVRERRYGVLSEVLVKDKSEGLAETVRHEDFLRRGGCRRQVLYMPRKSSGEAMRYTGAYQIQKSKALARQVEITLPGAFQAQPGDVADLRYPPLGLMGEYDVVEAESRGGPAGTLTTIVMEAID